MIEFIGFALTGRPANDSRIIGEDISKKFSGPNYFDKHLLHLTFKISFEVSRVHHPKLVEHLRGFAYQRKPFQIILSGFHKFHSGVIYRDVIQNGVEINNLQSELCDSLVKYEWVKFHPVEPNGIPHSTVGEGLYIRHRLEQIINYVRTKYSTVYNEVSIDRLHLFSKKPGKTKWTIDETFKFT